MAISLHAPRATDLDAIEELLAARERADLMDRHHWQALVLDQWNVEAFDPAADAVLAKADGDLAGFAALFHEGGFVAVDPGREGGGVGAQLLIWLERRAGVTGRSHHRQLVAATNERAIEFLTSAGYRRVRSYLRMVVDLPVATSPGALPPGFTIRELDVVADGPALHALDDASFAGNADYAAESLQNFREEHLTASGVAPELSLVAWRGQLAVGMAIARRRPEDSILIDLLAVAPDQRRHGLGTALLLGSWRLAAQDGARRALLDVASDNLPALWLYERAGMVEAHRAEVFEKEV